ncbi:DUF1365-domain-containing protein [Choiromyces venosus 120613-1]|uniref:DUF1365-domain-containing protein n=1 Tax=Choiromyces venosus 120613-1 TaxID=1336337 RepID=A0A3N4JEV4_9PEZI|nr:DUF1365-domain-containing protein [Choiromyces venosus 120613-1]
MCCAEDLLTRGLLLFNASSVLLFASCPFSNGLVRAGTVGFVGASVLQVVDVWRSGFGFWDDLVAIYLVIFILKIAPFVWRTVRWGGSCEREELGGKFLGRFRPMLFFCSTTHARFLPKKHTFKYPLLYVGFPVNFKGSIGELFSVLDSKEEKEEKLKMRGKEEKRPFTFFSLDPAGYINPELPFERKLDSVLIHHGVDPSLYPYIYLVTTPRFFGYSFNPVSYYYLYSPQQELKLVVLEVLNTFGERHLYLLHADNPSNPAPRKGYTFAGEMEKTFHISPFNHRSGNYNIQVRDPLDTVSPAASKVDMHMVVIARDGTKSMVARAFSVSPSFDMINGGTCQGLVIAATWGYNTFLAVPWTMWEAWKLYRKKAVVYTRPEVLAGSGQREATKSERFVVHPTEEKDRDDEEEEGADYFEHRVSTYSLPISVTITLPESNATKAAENVTFYSEQLIRGISPAQTEASKSRGQSPSPGGADAPSSSCTATSHLTIRVSNPRFFTRFFSHQDPLQTIYLDIISQPDERRLAEVNNLPLFQDLLHPHESKTSPKKKQPTIRFRLFNINPRLRRLKTSLELSSLRPDEESLPPLHPISYRSTLDEFFRASCRYRRNCMKAVLVDLIAFGEAESLDLYEKVLEVGVWSVTIGLMVSLAASMQLDIGGLAGLGGSMWSSFLLLSWSWSWSLPADLAGANAPLLWSAVKAVF